MNWLTAKGKIVYDPKRGGAHKRANGDWVVCETSNSIVNYYRWWIEREILNPPWAVDGIVLNTSRWGAHITILDGRIPVKKEIKNQLWKKYQNQIIEFEYSPEMIKNIYYFWVMPVRCDLFSKIRQELGLNPNYHFHLTIGRQVNDPKVMEKNF